MATEPHQRVDALEKHVSRLSTELAGVKSDIAHVSDQIREVVSSVKSMAHTVAGQQKTNWGTLGAWAGVIVTALCTLGELRMAPLHTEIASLKEQIVLREKLMEEKQKSTERMVWTIWEATTGKPYPHFDSKND